MELTATELKERDPKRFEKEYWDWVSYSCDHDWWDCIEENFKADMAVLGCDVGSIEFSLSYSQGDGAAFNGSVDMAQFLEHQGLKEKYLALWYDFRECDTHARVSTGRNSNYVRVNLDDYYLSTSTPQGVFSLLDQEAWDLLVCTQYDAEDWEKLVQEWAREKCDELYRQLQDEHEYLTSEEEFIASCEANDITFEVEGEETCDS